MVELQVLKSSDFIDSPLFIEGMEEWKKSLGEAAERKKKLLLWAIPCVEAFHTVSEELVCKWLVAMFTAMKYHTKSQ